MTYRVVCSEKSSWILIVADVKLLAAKGVEVSISLRPRWWYVQGPESQMPVEYRGFGGGPSTKAGVGARSLCSEIGEFRSCACSRRDSVIIWVLQFFHFYYVSCILF